MERNNATSIIIVILEHQCMETQETQLRHSVSTLLLCLSLIKYEKARARSGSLDDVFPPSSALPDSDSSKPRIVDLYQC